jgi:ankyrin repeat protein
MPVLVWAAIYVDEETVSLMLAKNELDPNLEGNEGKSPLVHSARRGSEVIVKALLTIDGLKIDSQDKGGRTALSYAAEGGHISIVEQLIYTGKVNVNSTDLAGLTPLSFAANEEITKILISAGASTLRMKKKE